MTSRPCPDAHADPLGELIRTLTPKITTAVRRCRLGWHDTEDVVQDVWVLLIKHQDSIRDPRGVSAWLRTTAVREAVRAAERSRRETPSDHRDLELTSVEAVDAVPHERLAQAVRDTELWHAVDRLPDRDRLLARLLAHQPELTYADLAAQLGVATNSVGQLRTRCLRRLRGALVRAGITGTT